jgi:hypothetical protein
MDQNQVLNDRKPISRLEKLHALYTELQLVHLKLLEPNLDLHEFVKWHDRKVELLDQILVLRER